MIRQEEHTMLTKHDLIPVTATPRAIAMVKRLALEHGPLAIFQSGGCCDGSLPLCLSADQLPPGPNDVQLGDVAGVPFYIDAEQYQRWGGPEFLLDVSGGAPEGFSLGLPDAHFVSLSASGLACQARAALVGGDGALLPAMGEPPPLGGRERGRTMAKRPQVGG